MTMPTDRRSERQAQAILSLRQALRGGSRRPMLQAATGFGKTHVASEIIRMANAKGNRVGFIVPALELIDQTVARFSQVGITDIGVMQADHVLTDPSKPVQVISAQTLRRRQTPDVKLWINDEAHRMDRHLTDLMGAEEWADTPFIGLSATPWTKGLGRLYDKLIIAATTKQGIEEGWLSPFRAFAPAHPDLSGVRTVAGDYHEGQLSAAMQKGTLVGDIVTTWEERGENRPTLCFCVDCAHAKAVQRSFQNAGINAGYMDAETPRLERDRLRKAFHRHEVPVICNIGVLTIGVDWDVRCIILARPTKSEILLTQIVGRGLRTAPGKDHLILLDHSDSTLNLGLVTEIHHERLHDGNGPLKTDDEKEKSEPLPRCCEVCAAIIPPKVAKCPSCGHERERLSEVSTVGGEIVEISGRIADKRNREETWDQKRHWIASLRRYAANSGKDEKWVSWRYRDRYGCWPNDVRVKYADAADVADVEVLSWIRHRNIAYANRRNR